jgi:hypothetical protein
VKTNSRLLWVLLASGLAVISIASSLQQFQVISGVTAVLSATFTIYSLRLGRGRTARDRFIERTGYLLVESALLGSILLNPAVPRWLAVVSLLGMVWAEVLPEVYRKVFGSSIWLTMGRDVRVVLVALGVISGSFNPALYFYMTVIYLGACVVDVLEVTVHARNR